MESRAPSGDPGFLIGHHPITRADPEQFGKFTKEFLIDGNAPPSRCLRYPPVPDELREVEKRTQRQAFRLRPRQATILGEAGIELAARPFSQGNSHEEKSEGSVGIGEQEGVPKTLDRPAEIPRRFFTGHDHHRCSPTGAWLRLCQVNLHIGLALGGPAIPDRREDAVRRFRKGCHMNHRKILIRVDPFIAEDGCRHGRIRALPDLIGKRADSEGRHPVHRPPAEDGRHGH